MPWQGHYLVTRHLGRKKQGRQVCRRCRRCRESEMCIWDAGMQRCWYAGRQSVFDCFWWLSWTSVQTLLQIDEASFLDAADFDVQVQHCRAIRIIFRAFNSSPQDFNTSLQLKHLKPACTPFFLLNLVDWLMLKTRLGFWIFTFKVEGGQDKCKLIPFKFQYSFTEAGHCD